ncbi:MAG: trypsin-like peptidase domain-containing protein [Fuerstiella sp.]
MTDHRDDSPRPPTSALSTNMLLVLILGVLSLVLAFQAWSGRAVQSSRGSSEYTPREIAPKEQLGRSEQATISVFRQSSPSVVFIRTRGYQLLLSGDLENRELSSGTGFVWDQQGHIVTNLHVVEDALRNSKSLLEVQYADHSVVDAEIIGGVREHDIAVLRVRELSDHLVPIRLGTSDDLQVGQHVLAIGSPFGFDQTLSTGVIGGLKRSVATEDGRGFLDGLIQTDAAINPGNSGGPLLDSAGRMIGVNTAIVSPTGAYSGLGFAVPVSSVIASVDLVLEEAGGRPKPALGISVLSPEQAAALGVPEQFVNRGLFIKQIDPRGPAAGIGLLQIRQQGYRVFLGDQLVSIDDVPVTTLEELKAVLEQYAPGDTVTLGILRRNQPGEVDVTLQTQKLIF